MGTDSGVGPHGNNLEELALMTENSTMSPMDAWTATTASAARLLGASDQLGAIAPGKLADLVVLDGDPMDLDKTAERIGGVWKDGSRVV
jgi:imidazolonepropionase-like amidohydrolase